MDNARYEYLNGRYRELTILGSEEKKSTYLAQDVVSGQIVVKKYIQRENADIYELLRTIKNPHLMQIFHVVRGKIGALVIMEYVSGRTVEEWQKENPVFSETETIYYMEQLLNGLMEIHKWGIVHRDINPRNVLISTDGVVKLLDFDIGRRYKDSRESDTMILGTVGYAAPEQFGFTQSDKRTDIYAIGVLINVMLTGKLPGEQMYTNGKCGDVVRTCIQLDPEKRYQNVEEILQEIQNEEHVPKDVRKKSIWPGFRTGKTWKKVIAILYYYFFGTYSIECITELAKTPLSALLGTIAVIMYMWLPVFLPLNFLHWMDKMPGIRKLGMVEKVILSILLSVSVFYCGAMLETYVKENLLYVAVNTA